MSMSRENDAQRIDRPELEQFEEAILSHLRSLFAVAYRLERSHSDAEDLVQDTLVKALRARAQYKLGTNLKAWLFAILKNVFFSRYRRNGRERSLLDASDPDPMSDGWVGEATLRASRDPDARALRPVLQREIGSALDAIPEPFRLVVLLADVAGLSYREIADAVGCPIGTVMSCVHRGRCLLRGRLIEHARAMDLAADDPIRAPASPNGKARRVARLSRPAGHPMTDRPVRIAGRTSGSVHLGPFEARARRTLRAIELVRPFPSTARIYPSTRARRTVVLLAARSLTRTCRDCIRARGTR